MMAQRRAEAVTVEQSSGSGRRRIRQHRKQLSRQLEERPRQGVSAQALCLPKVNFSRTPN